jgi:hypothetical protein
MLLMSNLHLVKYLNIPYCDFSGRLSLTKSARETLLKSMFLPYFFKKVGKELPTKELLI